MNHDGAKYVTKQLKKIEDETGIDINRLRLSLALERILARIISDGILSEHLIFKGGFVLYKVYGSSRYTRDIDALADRISFETIQIQVAKAIEKDLSDGFWFGDLVIEELTHQGKYNGLRFDTAFQIGDHNPKKVHKLPRIHFDVGIGDSIGNSPVKKEFDPLLKIGEPISWRVYPPQFIYSEKLETLVNRGSMNSRAKDYYDLGILLNKISVEDLVDAIRITFSNRGTRIPTSFSKFISALDFKYIEPSWKAQGFGEFYEAIEQLKHDFKKIDDALEVKNRS